jgi:hypothetical protein
MNSVRMYSAKFKNGITRVYNLRNVNIVELNKNSVHLQFNTCKINSNVIVGSGSIDAELHKETISFKDEKEASANFEEITVAIRRIE